MRLLKLAPLLLALCAAPAFGQSFSGPATISQPTTPSDCVKIDPTRGSNNLVDAGAPCGTGAAPSPANPTATIGATAVNGSASTFMRSDAAPPLPATLPALNGSLLTNLSGGNLTIGSVANAALINSATTVNGQTCTLGSTCTVTAAASGVTVGTTTVSGGVSGRILYDNGGTLAENTVTGTGNVVQATGPTLVSPALGTPTALVLTNASGLPDSALSANVPLLNGANAFTGNNSLAGSFTLSGRTDATIAADQNNWTPTGTGTYANSSEVFVDGGVADRNITGLTGGAPGRIVGIVNKGTTNSIIIKNQSGSSTASNQFLLPADVTLPPNTALEMRYDGTASAWRPWGRALANTGVTAGSYTYASVTVDVAGRVTAASSGSAPATAANPSASITGPVANGSAPSFMRSDAVPALGTIVQLVTVNLNATAAPSPITGAGLLVNAADGVTGRVQTMSYGAISAFSTARANGTAASPTGLVNADQIGGVNGYGWTSAAALAGPAYSYRGYATETWSGTANGTKACIATTANTTTTLADKLCVDQNGAVSMTGSLAVTGVTTLNALTTVTLSDALTSTVGYPFILNHMSSGTTVAGFGVAEKFQLQNGSGTLVDAGENQFTWSNVSAGNEGASWIVKAISGGALTQIFSITSGGTNVGFLAGADLSWSGRSQIDVPANGSVRLRTNDGTTGSFILSTPAVGTVQLGAADADTTAAIVTQTLRSQGLLAGGTSNQAGTNLTIIPSPGKGSACGGSLIVKTGTAGSTGTVVNTLATALTIDCTQTSTFAGSIVLSASNAFISGKATDPGTAPGAAFCKEYWVAGTNAGTGKKIAYCGTSTTPVTIVDNVGAGF